MIEQAEAVLGREAPRLGAHLEDADARRVVDEDLRLAEHADRLRQPLVFALADGARIRRCASMRATDVSRRMNSCSATSPG